MHFAHAYIRLAGEYGEEYRRRIHLDFLPIVSPFPETIDAGEYGQLTAVDSDASRLTTEQRARLIDWVWLDGDQPDQAAAEKDVVTNKVCYVLNYDGDDSEIILHDPDAWG
jgi:hypothetical protein